MKRKPLLTIDCGASRVVAAVYSLDSDGFPVLEKVFVEPLDYDVADDMQWVRAVGDALRRIGTVQRLRMRASLIVPGHLTLTKYIKVPHVDETKRRRIIHFEARQNIPYPLDEVVWDHQVVHDDGIDFEVALCAIKREIIDALLLECRDCGFEPERIEPSCMAQVNAFRHCYPEARETTLLINIGARSTNLVMLREDRYYIRNVTLAGSALTQSLADELNQGFAEAEATKMRIVAGDAEADLPDEVRQAFARARAGFVNRLSLEVTRSIANYRRQTGADAPTEVFLAGSGSLVPGLAAALSEKFRTPIEPYDALRGVALGAGVVEGELRARAPQLAESVGAALSLCGRGLATFNLLPEDLLRARAFRARQPMLVVSGVLVAATLAVPILVSSVAVTAYREKLATLELQATPLRQYSRQIQSTREEIERVRAEIAGIKNLVETKANWITFLTDLQARLSRVEDVWLDRLEVLRPRDPSVRQSALAASVFAGLTAPTSDEVPELRLHLTGRLLDKNNPLARVSVESQNRVKTLLSSFVESDFIIRLENERFDNSRPGLLQFDFILVVNPKRPL